MKFDPKIEGHCAKKKKVSDTHTNTMPITKLSGQNLLNNPKNPLVSGSGTGLGRGDSIGNPQNIMITTLTICGDKYNVSSALSFQTSYCINKPNF